MSFATEHSVIEKRFSNQWGTRTEVKYQGTNYRPRQGIEYVSFEISPVFSEQITLGGSGSQNYRHIGNIFIRVYTPMGKGAENAKVHADYAAGIFRSTSIASASVYCRTPRIFDGGESEGWYSILVDIPYYRDEIF